MASWRNGTNKQYSAYITKWQNFCNQRQVNHLQSPRVPVLDFLTTHQGLTYTAINIARSALSSYITLGDGTCVEKHPLVSRLMKDIFQEKPPRPKDPWNLGCVYCPLIPSIPIPCGNIASIGTYVETCVNDFISVRPKRSDYTFVKYRSHVFFE